MKAAEAPLITGETTRRSVAPRQVSRCCQPPLRRTWGSLVRATTGGAYRGPGRTELVRGAPRLWEGPPQDTLGSPSASLTAPVMTIPPGRSYKGAAPDPNSGRAYYSRQGPGVKKRRVTKGSRPRLPGGPSWIQPEFEPADATGPSLFGSSEKDAETPEKKTESI